MRNRRKLVACCVGSSLVLTALAVQAEERAPNDSPEALNGKAAVEAGSAREQKLKADGSAREQKEEQGAQDLAAIADDAYVYAYPLMLVDATARLMTNVASPDDQHAPVNQFTRVESLPTAQGTTVEAGGQTRESNRMLPNVDMLHTASFLDLSHEPVVLHVPNMHGRYYVMSMLDAYSNVFASAGKRTMGTDEQDVAIVGPNFKGDLPWGLSKIAAPTDRVWVLGSTQVNAKDDVSKVAELTHGYAITPLSSYGRPYAPSQNDYLDRTLDMTTTPAQLLASMGDRAYLERAALLLKENPPPAADKAELAKLAKLGFNPGALTPTPAGEKAIIGASKRAMKRIRSQATPLNVSQSSWQVPTADGKYGTNYEERAAVALNTLGASLPQDAISPWTTHDFDGQVLDGNHRYTIHIEQGREPPVYASWSVTMYDAAGKLVDNSAQRYAIGSRDALKRNPDGSLDILIQADAPEGALARNWLPAPRGPFQLVMRMYWPQKSVLSGNWRLPYVERAKPK